MLRPFIRFLLLLGAVIGLSGQAFAAPSAPCAEMVKQQAMAGMADCNPDTHKPGHDSAPCKDMSAACIAMSACAAIAMLDGDQLPLPSFVAKVAARFWQATPVLHGRTIPPDPDPPSRLG